VGQVVDQVSPVSARVEGCVLGKGGGGGVELEASVGGGAGALAVGVDPDARVASSVVDKLGGGAVEGGGAGGLGGGSQGGGLVAGQDRVGRREPREVRGGVAASRGHEARDGRDHLEVAVVGEDRDHGGGAGGHASDDVVGDHGEAGVREGVDEVVEALGVGVRSGGGVRAARGVQRGVSEEGGDRRGVGAEGDGAGHVDLELAEKEDKLAAAGLGGVKVEAGLGGLAEGAGLAVLGGDPAVLEDVSEDGRGVEGEAGEGSLASAVAEGGVAGEVGGAVVVLEDAAAVEETPGTGAGLGAAAVDEGVASDLLDDELDAVVELGAWGNRADADLRVGIAKLGASAGEDVVAVGLLGVLGAEVAADEAEGAAGDVGPYPGLEFD